MNIFFAALLLWVVIAAFDYGEFCYLWQLKEYRLDRFKDFVSTKQGRDFLKSYLVSGRLLFLFLAFIFLLLKIQLPLSIITLIIIFELVRLSFRFFKKQIKYPAKTFKAILIMGCALVAELVLLSFIQDFSGLLVVFALRFVILSAVVFVFYIPTKAIKIVMVFLAERKLGKYANLKVVGITGSYGKTTVKNFLYQILQSDFKVIATPKNINTEIGIAKFILQTNFSEKEVFVVEMGAYNMGEIRLICDMVHPKIGILTAINEQHLSLFGSIKNIQKAKYELLRCLPKDGLAIINSDNNYCREFISELDCNVKTFGEDDQYDPSLLIKDVVTSFAGSISFKFVFDGKNESVSSNVSGKHNAMNIGACILAANQLGQENKKIIQQIKMLKLPEGTLQKYVYGESIIIDDSYNSNPDGFLAALEMLKDYSDEYKKIVITRGMIELGKRSQELHQRIGERIAMVAQELVIFSSASEEELKGATENRIQVAVKNSADDLCGYIKELKNQKAVVLIENRVPEIIINEIKGN